MRIAHVTSVFPPYQSGMSQVAFHNALEQARAGHDVSVYTAIYAPAGYVYPPEIRVNQLPHSLRIGNAALLPGLLRIRDVDLIHLHYPFPFGHELIWLTSKTRGIPYVVTHHADLIGDGGRRVLFDMYSAASARLLIGGARKVVVVTQDFADHSRLAPLYRQRPADMVVVPNGVDTERFRPLDDNDFRAQHGIAPAAKIVLLVSALDRAHHFRRLDVLLYALSLLDDPAVCALIVGDGDRRAQYEALAADLGIACRVRFLGAIPHEALPPIYAAADVLVLPSHIQESFGMVLIEAMACGTPVIASRLPGVRSVICDGEDGFLVEPSAPAELAETLQRLLSDDGRRRAMGQRGREKVQRRYAWPHIARELIAVYESALS